MAGLPSVARIGENLGALKGLGCGAAHAHRNIQVILPECPLQRRPRLNSIIQLYELERFRSSPGPDLTGGRARTDIFSRGFPVHLVPGHGKSEKSFLYEMSSRQHQPQRQPVRHPAGDAYSRVSVMSNGAVLSSMPPEDDESLDVAIPDEFL